MSRWTLAMLGEVSRDSKLRAAAIALASGALFVVVFQACGGGLGSTQDASAPAADVYGLFACSPCNPPPGDFGVAGCTTQTPPGTCNQDCQSYTASVPNGIQMTAGNDCHTVNTNASCMFSIGDGGVTQIDFDFSVTNECHDGVDATEWLSFWIYSSPWSSSVEADFIESLNGPGGKNGGLNSNFAGNGNQVEFLQNATPNWSGHITAKFSGSGNNVATTISNGVDSQVASSTLATDSGYFFVMDTALGSNGNTQCSFTITNLRMKGTVDNGQCTGLVTN